MPDTLPRISTTEAVYRVAEKVSERLMSALLRHRIAAINIDTIRAACEIAAHYEGLTADELQVLEDRALRRAVERVG